jgi:Putative restriction endonuclease
MSQPLTETQFDLDEAVRNLVTEDDEPVDNILSEKQQRLLVDPLYEDWTPPFDPEAPVNPRPFWAASNVGIFRSVHLPGIAPDFFLSVDVTGLQPLKVRSYFMWEYGKAPDLIIEIVSNRKGQELTSKFKDYAQMGVTYYVIYDPYGHLRTELNGEVLSAYEIGFGKRYRRRDSVIFADLDLSLTLWEGPFEGCELEWLRWCDAEGRLLLTGHERAASEADARRQAEDARRQAEDARRQAADARREAQERAAKLASRLHELGVDPDQL